MNTMYYTEYPLSSFYAKDDEEALLKSSSKVIYKESDTENGLPFIVLRDEERYE